MQVSPTSFSSSPDIHGKSDFDVGAIVGAPDGSLVGLPDGSAVGLFDGKTEGARFGEDEGKIVGTGNVGFIVGDGKVGVNEGLRVGEALVGSSVGVTVGTVVGSLLLHKPHSFGQLLCTTVLLQDVFISSKTMREHRSAS